MLFDGQTDQKENEEGERQHLQIEVPCHGRWRHANLCAI